MAVAGKNSSYSSVFWGTNTKNEKSMTGSWYFYVKNAKSFMKKLPRNHGSKKYVGVARR